MINRRHKAAPIAPDGDTAPFRVVTQTSQFLGPRGRLCDAGDSVVDQILSNLVDNAVKYAGGYGWSTE